VVNFTPRPLYPRGKSPQYPLYTKLCGPQNQSGRRGEKTILDPTGTRTQTQSFSPYPVAIPTALCWLSLLFHTTLKQIQFVLFGFQSSLCQTSDRIKISQMLAWLEQRIKFENQIFNEWRSINWLTNNLRFLSYYIDVLRSLRRTGWSRGMARLVLERHISQERHRVQWQIFRVFLSLSRQMQSQYID
jgi:hypothetical protein